MKRLFILFTLLALVGLGLPGCGGGGGDSAPSQALQDLVNTGNDTNTSTPAPDPSVINVKSVTLSTSGSSVQAGGSLLLTATVLGNDDKGLADQSVSFTSTSGGSFSAAAVKTDSNGIARVSFSPPTIVGSTNVYATAGFVNSGQVVEVQTTAGPVDSLTVTAPGYTLPTGTETAIDTQVVDRYGNPVSGASVRYSLTANNSQSIFSTKTLTSDTDGWTSVPFTTGSVSGIDTLTVTSGGKTGTANITVSSTAVRVVDVKLTTGASTLTANGSSGAKLRAQVIGTAGSAASGVTVNFTTSLGTLSAATAITDRDGYAEVTLTAPTTPGTGEISASANDIWSNKSTINFTAAVPSTVTVTANPNRVGLGRTSELRVTVTDSNGLPVTGEVLTYSLSTNASGGSLGSTAGVTDNSGQALISYTSGSTAGTDTITARTRNARIGNATITVDPTAATPTSLTLTSANATLPADGAASTQIRATASNSKGPVQGITINFATNAGTLPSGGKTASATTDSQGIATVILTAQTAQAVATLSATTAGLYQDTQVRFMPGQAVASNSSLTAAPASLPADGTGETTITAFLADANGNLVADGTQVTLLTSAGSLVSANPATTLSGRATFTLRAPASKAAATLSIREVTGLSGSVLFGSAATGGPANILVSPAESKIFVAGVTKRENTSISIQIQDAYGSGLDETTYASNTARVSFLTRPFGGEYLSGVDALGATVSSEPSGSIDIRTKDGIALVNLQAGQLPGVVEIRVEALDETGNPLAPAVVAALPQITIASGPPHTIALTFPNKDSITNLGGGVYRRIAKAIVTDRFGNSVPDGTAIYFGLVDSVIAEGSNGQTAAGSRIFTDGAPILSDGTPALFNTAAITRNSVTRGIQVNDRLLTFNASAEDKNRHITSVDPGSSTVQNNYANSRTGLNYLVGASLLGGYVSGLNAADQLATGQGITKDGVATFYVTYPANSFAINTGFNPWIDTRTNPLGSARVYVVAASSDNSATTINEGTFFFAPIAPFKVKASPATISGTTDLEVTIRDNADVPVPFQPINSFVSIDNRILFDACIDTTKTTLATCTPSSSFAWHAGRELCVNRNISEDTACTGAGRSWITKIPSTFDVAVYIGNKTLDSDMVPGAATHIDTDLDLIDDFYSYPWTRVGGSANARIVVRGGDLVQQGDTATVTFSAGDQETTVTVKIP